MRFAIYSSTASAADPIFIDMATILLVEDNEDNRDVLARRLRRSGHEVLVAEDGAQGLSMANNRGPDLILMDLDLPQIDGWEVARRLKASPETARIPIVALTAHAMGPDRKHALDAGCDDYMSKPVDYPCLIRLIGTLLGSDHS